MIANKNDYIVKEKRIIILENLKRIFILFDFCQSCFTENLKNQKSNAELRALLFCSILSHFLKKNNSMKI